MGIHLRREVLDLFTYLTLFLSVGRNLTVSSPTQPTLLDRSPIIAYHIVANDLQRSGPLTIWEMSLLRSLAKKWGRIPEYTVLVLTPYREALKRL